MVDSSDAEKSISKTGQEAESLGSKLGSGIATAGKWAAGLTAGAAAVGGAMLASAKSTATAADTVDKASIRMGIDAEQYQKLSHAAELSGVSMSTMEKAAKTLQASGSELSFDDALDQIMSITDESERAAAAAEMFGDKAAYDMAPLLQAGAEGLSAMKKEAEDMGIVMSNDSVKAGANMNDTLTKMNESFAAVKNQIGVQFMPVLTDIINMIMENMPMIQGIISSLAPVITGFLTTLLPPLMELATSLLPVIIDLINQVIPFISEILDAILPILIELLNTLLPPLIQIVQSVLPIIISLLQPLLPLLQPILSLLSPLIDLLMTLLTPLLDLINTILPEVIELASEIDGKVIGFVVEAITKLVEKVTGFVSNMVSAGKELFTGLWDGIKSVWESITGWVTEKVEWLTDKLAFWRKGSDEMSSGKADGSHAAGLPFVPFDGYKAVLHRGETVLSSDNAQGMVEGIVNGIAGILGGGAQTGSQPIAVNIQLDKKTMASALVDPMSNVLKQRGVAFG